MEMEDLSLKVRENVMDQEMEVEDTPLGILDMRSAQQKGGTTLGQSRSKLGESPPHDFGLQQQVQHPGGRGQWNGNQEARKHNENSDVQEALELQDKLRDFNVL